MRPREWLVPDMVPMREVTMFSGDGGTGKSLLALQLAYAKATGTDFFGKSTDEAAPVLVFTAEDELDEVHRRLEGIRRHAGGSFGPLDSLHVASRAGEDALFATLAPGGGLEPTELYRRVEEAVLRYAPALVILDTLADLFPGDENNRAQARAFVGLAKRLAMRGPAVMLLAHPSLTGKNTGTGLSGSTAWNGSVRARLYLDRPSEGLPDFRELSTKKSNYGPLGATMSLRWSNGVFVPVGAGFAGPDPAQLAEDFFLDRLRRTNRNGRFLNPNTGPHCAPAVFEREGGQWDREALRAAMDRLIAAGKIEVIEIRENGRDRKVLRVVGETFPVAAQASVGAAK